MNYYLEEERKRIMIEESIHEPDKYDRDYYEALQEVKETPPKKQED